MSVLVVVVPQCGHRRIDLGWAPHREEAPEIMGSAAVTLWWRLRGNQLLYKNNNICLLFAIATQNNWVTREETILATFKNQSQKMFCVGEVEWKWFKHGSWRAVAGNVGAAFRVELSKHKHTGGHAEWWRQTARSDRYACRYEPSLGRLLMNWRNSMSCLKSCNFPELKKTEKQTLESAEVGSFGLAFHSKYYK